MSQHYSKAPIAEAVISLRIDAARGVDLARLRQLADALPAYPARLPIKTIQMGVAAADTSSLAFHNAQEETGLRLESSDGRRVLQLQKHEFTFSHLHPYSSWSEFAAEGKRLWPLFASTTGAERVVRAAVRVINKLELSAPIRDLPQYVSLLPMVPSSFAGPPETFFMQLQLSMAHLVPGCRCVVNVASGSQPESALSTLLLDFDLFVQGSFGIDNESVWPLLDTLSAGKNELFEACITDVTRALIR